MVKEKTYEVIYKFAEVVDTITAKNKLEAEQKANEMLLGDYNPQNDTNCLSIKIKEIN